jgi:carboxypeptidase C (cathepsin A)
MEEFYLLFPALQTKKLFLTGESYGGHYGKG